MKAPTPPRVYVARCTAGCTLTGTAAKLSGQSDGSPRLLEDAEIRAHEDRHMRSRARPWIRSIRDLPTDVRAEVLAYFVDVHPNDPPVAYSEALDDPITVEAP